MSENIKQTLARIGDLHPKIIDLSLDRIKVLLQRLGDPHLSIGTVIHIAGTNGKGSTYAFLKAFLEASGLKINGYTSPHLVHFNERIVIQGREVPDDLFLDALQRCEASNGGQPITFFEITTAAAFLLFAENRADITILETGLGGRFDATNVIDDPKVCVLTPIAIDHVQYLGSQIATIAKEKAGIIKNGTTVVSAVQYPEVTEVIAAAADQAEARLFRYGRDFNLSDHEDGFIYRGQKWPQITMDKPPLAGRWQYMNAGTAIACLEQIDTITDDSWRQGYTQVSWPGRMQHLRDHPLCQNIPDRWELWLDGGHNAAAAQALCYMLHLWQDEPLHVIFAMMGGKDPYAFLRCCTPFVKKLYALAIPGVNSSLGVEEIVAGAQKAGHNAVSAASISSAIDSIVKEETVPHARILICGSLYLAADVLKQA